jgi:hypothetical protein
MLKKCKYCDNVVEGRKDKKYCSRSCKSKMYRKDNLELVKKKQKVWVEENKEYRKCYMKKYKGTEEYRIMKQRHDKKYYDKNKKKYKKRNDDERFKSACRAYAKKRVLKIECHLCKSNERLELHHSEGYKKESIDGVNVVCGECHRQVIHGKGTRIKDNCR